MATVDFATFISVAPMILDVGLPVLIRGRHGIGKSEVVYQIAAMRGLPVVERRASQMTEGDLMGLPSIKGEATSWNPPDWYKKACNEPVLLFLDEVDRATLEVRQGIFELNDSRKLNGWYLHPKTVVMAAMNGGEHSGASSYQVGEMDPAELSRWSTFDLDPSVKDWLDHANGKVSQIIWDFIKGDSRHLEYVPTKGGFEPNKIYPDRRSWFRLDKTLDEACLLAEDEFGAGTLATIYHLACSFIGTEAAVSFKDFVEKYERQITVEDLLVKGKISLTKDWSLSEHMTMIEKFWASGPLAQDGTLHDDNIRGNLAEYCLTLPGEGAMALYTLVANNGMQNQNGVIKFHRHVCSNGQTPQGMMNEMLTAGGWQPGNS